MRILANLNVAGTLDIDTVTNAGADTDRFLVQDANGVVRYRTGAEVASDIGAAVGFVSTLKHEVKLSVAVGKGKAVYISGSDGTNMLASLASNASEATSTKTLGLTESAGAQNAKVFVVSEGLLAGLDTSTATIGDPVWLGVDGELIYGLANKPYAPAHMVFVGLVTRVNANNGEIFVKVQNGFELQELHNVQITTTPANNTVLAYETSSSLYKMKSIATLLGYTPADDAGVVHLAGTETITGTKTFTAATTTFAKVVANAPFGGATGEGIVVGKSFKLDASGEGEKAKIYVVTKDLSDTYGSGLQIQFANIDDNKGFGFNLNTAGGYEIYTKDAGAAWVKAMTISNTQLATFHGNVRLAAYTTNGFVKTSSSNGTITIDPAAFTLTTTGTNGPATYNSGTGVLNIPEYLGASGIRIVYNFTATAGQTTFTVTSYTPGVIDVYYNGSRLTEDEYTATNGTTIVLDTACAVGDLVDVIVYQGSINGFTGVGGSGTINQLTYWTGANTIGALSTATYPSLTEISYVKGVTSAIQTQLDAKVPTSRTLTINGTSYDLSANRSWTISGVTGSGTANQIAYWDGSSSVAGSTFLTLNLTADNGYLILTGGATYKNADIWLNRYSDAWENAIRFQTNGTTDWYLGSSATGSNSNLEFYSYGTTSAALTLLKASANANFGASVGIGNTTLTGYSLRVSRTMVGDTASGITSFGVVSDGTVQSAVTSGAFGFNSALSTAAAAFTLDSLIHFRATQGTIGNTSAVTNQYGFAALGTMTGATNNYGFFGSLDSATGRWNLYMSGTARNYLAGDTSIGTTTGGYKLNVSGTANISGVLTGTTGTFSSTLTGTGLRSFAVNTAQTPSNNAGWYTLARFNTYAPFLNTNGNSGIITLSFYGGGIYTPSRYRIFYFKDDANVATLKLEKYGAVDYIQEVRIRYRTGDTRYYIEIYCDSHASGLTFDVHHDRLFGYGDQLEIFGGVLDAASGTGTILATLPFVDHGTTVSSLNVVTSASFSSALTANSFVKSGGIASQFLKADGTVDSTTYQPALTNPVTGTGTNNYIPKFTATGSTIGDSSLYYSEGANFNEYTFGSIGAGNKFNNSNYYILSNSNASIYLQFGSNKYAQLYNLYGDVGLSVANTGVHSTFSMIYFNGTGTQYTAIYSPGGEGLRVKSDATLRLTQYTSNGFVKTSGGDGTLSVDTTTYQPQLNGTGFVKASGTTISYDNSTYMTYPVTTTVTDYNNLTNSVIGTTSTTATNIPYANHNITITLENPASAGRRAQLFFSDTPSSAGGFWWRPRQGDATGWHPWEKIITSVNIGSYAVTSLTDTLATVTGRGASTSTAITVNSSITAQQLLISASSPKITFTPSGYSGSYRSYLGTDSSAQGVLQLGNNGANYIVAGNTGAGGALLFYVNATSEFIAGANGTLALTLNSGGSASFEKTITVVGNATFKHGNTEYTMFTSTNEINHYNADGTYAKVYINWPGGDVDIARSSILARSAGIPKFPYGAQIYADSAGNSPAVYFGAETSLTSAKAIYLESYWMVLQGHYNEGYRFRYVNGTGGTTEAMTLKYNNTTINTKITYTDNTYMTGSPSYGFRFNSANDAYNNVIMYDGGNTYFRTSLTINYNTSGQPGGTIPTKIWVHDGVSAFSNASTGDSAISTATSSSLLLGPRGARSVNAGYYLAGISFDHLLSYSGAGTNFYSSVPHAWVGLRMVAYPGWETSALVFATRSDTSGTAGTTLERMCVMPDGKVGINTKSPSDTLHVYGTMCVQSSGLYGLIKGYDDPYHGMIFRGFPTTATNLTDITATDCMSFFEYGGDFRFYQKNNIGTFSMQARFLTGTLTVSGDVVAYGSPSDARLKTIKSKVTNAVEKINKINGYQFDWNSVDSMVNIKEDIGVIAQEVAEVLPELARTNEDGYMSVRYQGLTAVLIEAIKELAEENKQIKEELSKLKN